MTETAEFDECAVHHKDAGRRSGLKSRRRCFQEEKKGKYKMICEKAYYPNGDETKKLNCRSKLKIQEDDLFKERCPLIYYCRISGRIENTTDMFDCRYREAENE